MATLLRKQGLIARRIFSLCNAEKVCSCGAYSVVPKRDFNYGSAMVEGGPRIRGIEILRDPHLNKGTAFSLRERQILGIHGLLPPVIFSQDEQVERVMANIRHWDSDLDKYVYLSGLQDRNEKLFYRIITDHIEELAPIIYTPTVGLACSTYGFIFRKPRGLYMTINDRGHIHDLLCNWPEKDVKAVCMTDGERILGLGDLGAYGMGIPVGKLALYTAMGGVPPQQCLPIVLDVGTDNENLLEDPMYIGLRHKRVRGNAYSSFVEEVINELVKRFGNDILIQFEDFANSNAFWLLEKYRDRYCTFNDDIQGTASVVVAGFMSSMRLMDSKLIDQTYLFLGAGEAATGIACLLSRAMVEDGATQEEADSKIWMIDIDGLLTRGRPKGKIGAHQEQFAKDFKHMDNLEEICRELKPSVAVGAAAATGAFTETFLRDMASFNKQPVIFALSNPTSKAECTAEEAYTHTDGRCIFASGSPFAPVTYNGKTFHPGQGNNAYIFPGVGMGSIVSGARHITDGFFLTASRTLANLTTDAHFAEGRVYPPLADIREVSTKIAAAVVDYAYKRGMASTYPEPEDKEAFVRMHMYNLDYENFLPTTYGWPGMPE